MCTKILSKSSSMGFQKKWSGLPIILFLLFLLENSLTLTDSEDNIHDFLGLNDPFFNPNIDSMFRAQEGGVAYLSCEVTTFITTVNIARSPPHTPNQPYPNSYSFFKVFNLNNKSVSWVRGRDNHILTVDHETFISGRSQNLVSLKSANDKFSLQTQGSPRCIERGKCQLR